MALSVQAISLGYPKNNAVTTILQRVGFCVEAGTLTCILGPSGVGKSSLLRVIAGLDRPLSGSVQLFGKPIDGPHPEIGFVFQAPTLLPWLTVTQNVAFGLDFACREWLSSSVRRQRIQAAIAEVGLTDAANRLPHELSGGMAQRVNLARAVARNPSVMLLDEPFSALDPVVRTQMQQMLRQIVLHHQACAVMITHDIDEALALADHIILLGGDPASIIGQWQISTPFPRDNLLLLNEIRVDILRTLQRDRQQSLEQTVDYII